MGIYVWHKISAPPDRTRDPFEFDSAAVFEDKLNALIHAGIYPSTLSDYKSAPARTFAVTFDDGYANVAEQAMPVLERCRVRAIEFIVAGKLGGQNDWDIAKEDVSERLMDVAQIKTWLAAGHQIGSHSLTHPNLKKIPISQAREEIVASKKNLEDIFGVSVEHFCYPYGSYNDAVRDIVREAGYQTASTVRFGFHTPEQSSFELKRIAPLKTYELVRKVIHRSLRAILPGG